MLPFKKQKLFLGKLSISCEKIMSVKTKTAHFHNALLQRGKRVQWIQMFLKSHNQRAHTSKKNEV